MLFHSILLPNSCCLVQTHDLLPNIVKQECPNWVDIKILLRITIYWSNFVQCNGLSYKGFNPRKSCVVQCNGGPSCLHIN